MYNGGAIDLDVHHYWSSDADLLPYLAPHWRDYLTGASDGTLMPTNPASVSCRHTHGVNKRLDAFGDDGSLPGTSYELMRTQLLDPHALSRAVLGYDIGLNVAVPNPHYAAAIASAANDYTIEHWLSKDPRLASGILVASGLPQAAADEVRRVGSHPGMVQVLLCANGLGQPFGHPNYHCIYEAAAELGLPIAIHAAGEQAWGLAQVAAGGLPNSRMEFYTLATQAMHHHVASFVSHGVFERFPGLNLLVIEAGVSWMPWLAWTLDQQYPRLRRESPWVRRLPSEYIRDHVRLTTQPFEVTPKRTQLVDALLSFDGIEDMLCFATDYPHWDTDEPFYIAAGIPDDWHDALFRTNAARLFGWTDLYTPAA